MSRYKTNIVLSLLLVSFPALASFSLFVSVSPTNEISDMRPTIKSQGNKVVINVPYIEGEQKSKRWSLVVKLLEK